ncbi:MAG: NERD domain-containing protein [Desulfobulbaceae bacterium]|nr:NERD domain-containing protein [Desulfobulbaceae bacterium]HIJ79791.1 NERD domain-containing protein [Deltaproteobacteria bacterium]
MKLFIINTLPALLGILILLLLAVTGHYWQKFKMVTQKSPLTFDLLRNPGESVRARLEELHADLTIYLLLIPLIPFVFYSTVLSRSFYAGIAPSRTVVLNSVGIAAIFTVFSLFKIINLLKSRKAIQLELDCRMAVGQELNRLQTKGCHVFHDVPAGKFYIDHVVVGEAGVYAVNTLGREKPPGSRVTQDAKVTYDGMWFDFPDKKENAPINQAKLQSAWLATWLHGVTGEEVVVKPIIALPGWVVEAKERHEVSVINGKNPMNLATPREIKLSTELTDRIAFQLEQRCRNAGPNHP